MKTITPTPIATPTMMKQRLHAGPRAGSGSAAIHSNGSQLFTAAPRRTRIARRSPPACVAGTTRSPAPGRRGSRRAPSPCRPSVDRLAARAAVRRTAAPTARRRSLRAPRRAGSASVPPRRADLDVDRHRHVLAQVGRRIGHPKLDLHRAALRVDAGIDVDELGGEPLRRIGVGRGERRLAELQLAEVPLVDLDHQLGLARRARAPSAPCPAAPRRRARRRARSACRRRARRWSRSASRACARLEAGPRLLERGDARSRSRCRRAAPSRTCIARGIDLASRHVDVALRLVERRLADEAAVAELPVAVELARARWRGSPRLGAAPGRRPAAAAPAAAAAAPRPARPRPRPASRPPAPPRASSAIRAAPPSRSAPPRPALRTTVPVIWLPMSTRKRRLDPAARHHRLHDVAPDDLRRFDLRTERGGDQQITRGREHHQAGQDPPSPRPDPCEERAHVSSHDGRAKPPRGAPSCSPKSGSAMPYASVSSWHGIRRQAALQDSLRRMGRQPDASQASAR